MEGSFSDASEPIFVRRDPGEQEHDRTARRRTVYIIRKLRVGKRPALNVLSVAQRPRARAASRRALCEVLEWVDRERGAQGAELLEFLGAAGKCPPLSEGG